MSLKISPCFQWLMWVAAGACAGCGGRAQAEQTEFSQPPSRQEQDGTVRLQPASRSYVKVETVPEQGMPALVLAPGRVTFEDGAVARVAAPVQGRVLEVHVRQGERVKKGAALVTLSSSGAAESRAALARAQVSVRAAQAEAERQRAMMNQGVGVQSELVAAEARVDDARADLRGLESVVRMLGSGDSASVMIRAPLDGTVLVRRATPGGVADPAGEALIELGDPGALWLVAEVFERDLPLVAEGTKARVQVASIPEALEATVVSVGGAVDAASRRAPVYLSLKDHDPRLSGGMYARVTLEGQAQGGLAVPSSAILVKEGGKTVAYVAREDTLFERREVAVGHPVEGRVPVYQGLKPGDRLVIQGALLLDGASEMML